MYQASILMGLFFFFLFFSEKIKRWITLLAISAASKLLMVNMDRLNDLTIEDNYIKSVQDLFGSKYVFFVPYDRKHTARMSQYTAHLIKEDRTMVDITQYPGIPYSLSAKDMGGLAIEVHDEWSGEGYVYSNDEAPGYCIELMKEE